MLVSCLDFGSLPSALNNYADEHKNNAFQVNFQSFTGISTYFDKTSGQLRRGPGVM